MSSKTAVKSKTAAVEKTTPKTTTSATTAKATEKTTAKAAQKASVKVAPSTPQQKATSTTQQKAATAAMAKPAQPKISAPVAAKDVATPAREAVATKAREAKAETQAANKPESQAEKKPVNSRHGFKTNEYVVYPTHGVGRIVGIEEQEIAGMKLELFVITFEKDKMTLRVPTSKLQSVGMRKLASEDVIKKAMDTLKGRARIKRTMWSRRAQEYEAKINSGDLVAIAEVVRDLYRSETQPEQSYSERQLYEAALDRMAREIAAVEKLDEQTAVQRITEVLAKSARGRRQAEAEAEAEAADAEADGEEASPAVKAA
ncbi:MAG: CarD family transcriptional regulator [Pseudomonadota bacterium]